LGQDYENEIQIFNDPESPPLPGLLKSSMEDLAGCPCKQILVSALGNAQAVQASKQ